MTEYNIESDEIQMLKGASQPICNYSLGAIAGSSGSGKTTMLMKIQKAYIDQANLSKYNLDEPFINNGPITQHFFVSPSAKGDMTLNGFNNKKKADEYNKLLITPIDGTDEALDQLCIDIRQMRDETQPVLQGQTIIREIIKNKQFQEDFKKGDRTYIPLIIQQLDVIEKMKKKYQFLQTPETDKEINKFLTIFYKIFKSGTDWDGMFLRRQKILLSVDDMSGTHLFQTITSNIQEFGVFNQLFMQSLLNVIYLMNGLVLYDIEDVFEEVGRLQSPTFQKDQFLNLYKQAMGYDLNDYKQRGLFQHNYLTVFIYPKTFISLTSFTKTGDKKYQQNDQFLIGEKVYQFEK